MKFGPSPKRRRLAMKTYKFAVGKKTTFHVYATSYKEAVKNAPENAVRIKDVQASR